MAEEKAQKTPSLGKKKIGLVCEYMTYSGREAFKRLRTNVLISLSDRKKNVVIGITSAQPSEGKSTVSVNLAYSLAEAGKSVLLIDGDMRLPTINKNLGVRLSPGLNEILSGTENLKNTILRYHSSKDDTYFDFITSGEMTEHAAELLSSARFQKFLDVVSASYDCVVLDLPPVNVVVDAVSVAKKVDGLVVVIRQDHCPRYVLQECMEQLRYAGANVLGFVLNGCVEGSSKRYQYRNRYYYKYDYRYGK